MKASVLMLLMSVSAVTMADENVEATAHQQQAVEQYTYSMNLDIAKVLSVSQVSSGCEAGPVQMDFLDSTGKEHIVQYLEMGTGCSNG
ncbi:MAG: hypothetical protein JWR17_487 [Pseudomonas sp.]|jgi:hypothetical protein|uniref:DUF2790 domain-containing protein n=1 Tax=Pseudomonas sp. TaxID=306 RepID=UPI002618AA26|nr:DUF2790 domain-containing protein [Pseudomonas sp.]MDB6047741.1 hypothetical protein [Pseudomonas sp.]